MGVTTKKDEAETPARLRKSKITTWKETDKDTIVTYDGKIFLVLFDKVFPNKDIISKYNMFHIKKGSYEKQMPVITKYINFFMKFYDSEHEMLLAYLKLKFMIDKERMFNESNYKQLIAAIYDIFFTPTIVQKIKDLVEDNYLDDIESSEGSKKYISKEKKHLESLEFTNQHIKILLRISFGMKCIAPILFHFIAINVIKLEKDSEMIYEFYRPLFDIFSDGVNIYNKLFVYVNQCLGVR